MGLQANFIRAEQSFRAKYRLRPEDLMHLDYYARQLGFEGYHQGARADNNSLHPVCHGFREIAERRLASSIVSRQLDVKVELFAGKRTQLAAWGTYPQVVPADAGRLTSASYPAFSRCGCMFPDTCVGCTPPPGTEVLVVDVYALDGDVVQAYLRKFKVTLLSLQWVHPEGERGTLGGSEMTYDHLCGGVYGYTVPSGFSSSGDKTSILFPPAWVDTMVETYHHPRWLNRLGPGVSITDVFGVTEPLDPHAAVYSLFRISPVELVPIALGASSIERETLRVIAYTPEQQRGTLMRTLVNEGLVSLNDVHGVVEGIVRDLAERSRNARLGHTPFDSVAVAMSAKLQKDAAMSARLPVLVVLWLRFVSLPLKVRLAISAFLFAVSNLLLAVSWTAFLVPGLKVTAAAAWLHPTHFALVVAVAAAAAYGLRSLTI